MTGNTPVVKLPAFAHHRADSVDDAVAVLAEHSGDARVLAGGQSLLPAMARRDLTPGVLVDVAAVPDLRRRVPDDGSVRVGAAVTARELELATDLHPLLPATFAHSGHPEIRHRGTAAGSLGHADPASEAPALLLALGGSVTVVSTRGEREVAAADLVVGPHRTSLRPDELITTITFPTPGPGWSVREIARRDGDYATVGVVVAGPNVVLFGVAATPVRCRTTEAALAGGATPGEAAAHAFDGLEVTTDLRASAAYRRRAGTTLVARALTEARSRSEEVVHA